MAPNLKATPIESFSIHDKKTVDSKTFVHTINDPNQLNQFASYTPLFTLSALSQADLENTKTLLNSKPHDIIIKSGGIADGNLSSHNESSQNARERGRDPSNDFNKTLDQNPRMAAKLGKSSRTFKRDRDLYFTDVTMNSIPGLNEKRRLTSVTQIKMTIVEPAGISLFERMRAAAANNEYLDHLDAPYLLTVEFTGFNEYGKLAPAEQRKHMKRLIPIKMTDVQVEVNNAGSVYTATAIPYNEFAYVDRFNWPRTSGTLYSRDQKLNTVVKTLEQMLNNQNKEEMVSAGVSVPDQYEIYIDESFNPKGVTIGKDFFNQNAMTSQLIDPGLRAGLTEATAIDFMRISSSTAITKILEEMMKADERFSDITFTEWKSKVATTLASVQQSGGEKAVFDTSGGYDKSKSNPDMYFKYFRIRSTVIPMKGEFDHKRQTNAKKIKFVVEPYMIHAYSLAIPGVSTGQNFKNFVYKTYNYIFTGDNTDVLDLNINYRVAYFQSRLKDVDGDSGRKNKSAKTEQEKKKAITNPVEVADQSFLLKNNPSLVKSAGTGKTGGGFTFIDQFLDELTHPLADMVNIRMEILGDPAWLGQSQFIPANPEETEEGTSRDKDIEFWRGNREAIWDSKRKCYNADLAEPIILLNFKMPTDIDDKRGVYEMQSEQQAQFSGLYRVVQVEHNFNNGRYTNVLQLTRFNNQGVYISSPMDEYVVVNNTSGEGSVFNKKEYDAFLETEGGNISEVINIGRKINDLVGKVTKTIKSRVKSIARGFY
jgi:hypothetical protein